MPERETVEVSRLLRKSTLEQHVVVDTLPVPEKGHNVELIKLKPSFEGFSNPPSLNPSPAASPHVGNRRLADFGTSSEEVAPLPRRNSTHDILLNLPNVELVEVAPRDSGWFAVFTIDKITKDAIDAFVTTGRRHFKENRFQAGYISPFSEPLQHEVRKGAYARVSVQISEYCGKVMHTTFTNEDDEVEHGPGDELLDVYQKAPLGLCAATIHLMGYWYDLTKQGPLLYLTKLTSIARVLVVEPPSPPGSCPARLPGWGESDRVGSAAPRALELRDKAFEEARAPSPPALGSPGSPVLKGTSLMRVSPLRESGMIAKVVLPLLDEGSLAPPEHLLRRRRSSVEEDLGAKLDKFTSLSLAAAAPGRRVHGTGSITPDPSDLTGPSELKPGGVAIAA